MTVFVFWAKIGHQVSILTQGTCTLAILCLFLIARFSLCASTFFYCRRASFFLVNSRRHNFLPSFTFFYDPSPLWEKLFPSCFNLVLIQECPRIFKNVKNRIGVDHLAKLKKKYFSLAFSEFQWFSVIFFNLIQLRPVMLACNRKS